VRLRSTIVTRGCSRFLYCVVKTLHGEFHVWTPTEKNREVLYCVQRSLLSYCLVHIPVYLEFFCSFVKSFFVSVSFLLSPIAFDIYDICSRSSRLFPRFSAISLFRQFFIAIQFHLQSVQEHSANCVKIYTMTCRIGRWLKRLRC
jgi:hypothetical protein